MRPSIHLWPHLRTLALALASVLAGCATIAKGPYANVEVVAPTDVTIGTPDGAPLPLIDGPNGRRHLRLSTDSTQRILVVDDSLRFLFELERSVATEWLVLNLFSPVSLAIDAATRSWLTFGDVAIVYQRDSSGGRARIVSADSIAESRRRPPMGIVLVGGFGVSSPVAQAILFGNHYTAAVGYRLSDRVTLLASLCGQGCLDLEDYRGTTGRRPSYLCNVSSIELGADARFRVLQGLYLTGGIGRSSVQASRAPRFRESITYVSGGIGYAGGLFMFEVRRTYGLERVPIDGDVTAALRLLTVHFGLNLTI